MSLENPFLHLIPLLLIATLIDCRSQRIPNWLNASGLIIAMSSHFMLLNWQGLVFSFAGLLTGFCLLLPFYMMRGMGAGDVKLMAVVGSFIGAEQVFYAAITTLMAGGLLGIVVLILRGGLMPFLQRYLLMGKTFLYAGQITPLAPAAHEAARTRFPYAIAIATGTIYSLGQHAHLILWLKPIEQLIMFNY